MHLSATDGRKQVHLAELRGNGGGKSQRILPNLVTTGQEHITVTKFIGRSGNMRSVAVSAFVKRIAYAEVAVVAVTDGCEPGDFGCGEVVRSGLHCLLDDLV
jgi:hypothetical protein